MIWLRKYFTDFFTQYDTPKYVAIRSTTFGILCRILQGLILAYCVLYVIIHMKGYQKIDTAIISVTTAKVKGSTFVKKHGKYEIIDAAEYVIPSQQNSELFIMTNKIETVQTKGECPADPYAKGMNCVKDSDCVKFATRSNGILTGICVNAKEPHIRKKVCEIKGWCHVENDSYVPEPFPYVENFTILVKNYIEFPIFYAKRKNFLPELDRKYFTNCIYSKEADPLCPIFKIDYILKAVEKNATERYFMLKYGCVIKLKIEWICNLDRSISKCRPTYELGRLDVPFYVDKFSSGFNFRFAYKWKNRGRLTRNLVKAFGIKFVISVSGTAGKFDILKFSLTIGSIIGIIGLATALCDIAVLSFGKSKTVIREEKYQVLDRLFIQTKSTVPNNQQGYSPTAYEKTDVSCAVNFE